MKYHDTYSSHPIGIFDSGIGGLTVTQAITKILPYENIVYFGDTAHLPYGDKSTAAIQAYSIKICDMLLAQHCKLIVMACNSASSAAYELVKEYVGKKAHVINVIDPTIEYIREYFSEKKIGLIGTRQTVLSNVYKKKIDALNNNIELYSYPTPLLAPLIEEGFSKKNIFDEIINNYLSVPELANIEAIILACTHYPLIKEQINHFYKDKIAIIDNSDIVANAVKNLLNYHHALNKQGKNNYKKFYISDYTESFSNAAKLFFSEEIHLEHYPLWD
ncbi:MAG: Glutamate racemase [Legionellaceae bacterium]